MESPPKPVESPALDPRRNNFGLLRIVLASLVVLSHAAELLDGDRSREILTRIFGTIAFGTLAVDGFFVISGFLIVKSWASAPSIPSFLTKRVLRIYPGFIVASFISVFVVGRLAEVGHVELKELLAATFKNVARLYETQYPGPLAFPHSQRLNGSLWTIRWEFYCYLLAMGLGALGISRRRWPWLIVFLLAAAFVLFPDAFIAILPLKYDAAPRFLACFSSGALFYLYREKISYDRKWAAVAGAGLVGCLFSNRLAELGIATFGAYLIFAFAFAKIPRAAHIGTKNDISYGLYLYAWPIQQLLVYYLPDMPLPLHMVVCLAASCLAGFLSWRLVESPFMKMQKRIKAPTWARLRAEKV